MGDMTATRPVRVVSVRGLTDPAEVVYVGRRWAGRRGRASMCGEIWPAHPLANPFRLATDATPAVRAACIAGYTAWLLARPTLAADLERLWRRTDGGRLPLGCWCGCWQPGDPPLACHAVVLAGLLNDRYGRPT